MGAEENAHEQRRKQRKYGYPYNVYCKDDVNCGNTNEIKI